MCAGPGPQPEGRGEHLRRVQRHYGQSLPASMGPQPEGRGELEHRPCCVLTKHGLQWGHSPKAVENSRNDWIEWRGSVLLQWGHSPKAVENRGWRKRLGADAGGLQWGHSPKAVENGPVDPAQRAILRASMGPQPEGRGERGDGRGDAGASTPASMGPQPEGRGERGLYREGVGTASKGFNGATARRPWRTTYSPGRQVGGRSKLQWGHSPKAVENDAGMLVIELSPTQASMGPQPEGRGERTLRRLLLLRSAKASMGPQPEGRGERGGSVLAEAPIT